MCVRDESIAKIIDYIERVAKGDPDIYENTNPTYFDYEMKIDGVSIMFCRGGMVEVAPITIEENGDTDYGNDIMEIHKDIFASNIVGLWASIRDFRKKI